MIGALATKWAQLLISQPTVACPTQRGSRSNDELNKWEPMQVGAKGIVVRTESTLKVGNEPILGSRERDTTK